LVHNAVAAVELERQAQEKAEEVILRQMQLSQTMDQKLVWFKQWLAQRLPSGILELLDIDYRDINENGGYWYACFDYAGDEYRIYINGDLGLSLYAPHPAAHGVYQRILEFSVRTDPQKAAVKLLATIGTQAEMFSRYRAEAGVAR
jgi:hypothetical protein